MAAVDNSGSIKQIRMDGAASTSTSSPRSGTDAYFCRVCDMKVAKNHIMAHSRTLDHRNKSCVAVTPGVQRVETAFKSRIVTYRVMAEKDHVDISSFFNDIKPKVLNLIAEVVELHKAIKVNMVFIGRYFLPTQETYDNKSFNTTNQIITVGCDLDEAYQFFVEAMKTQAADFQEKDSGMFFMLKGKKCFV